MQVEGSHQEIQYGSLSQRVSHKFILEGLDATLDAAPTITITSPGGIELVTSQTMIQSGSTSEYYYDIDASGTGDWTASLHYRADIEFAVSGVDRIARFFFDVVKWPIGDPLLSSGEIDKKRPTWAAARPAAWGSDWQDPIENAHLELMRDLRNKIAPDGEYIRPSMVLDRGKLHEAAMKYTLYEIAEGIGLELDEIDRYEAKRNAAIDEMGPLALDYDDDLSVDDGEENQPITGIRILR